MAMENLKKMMIPKQNPVSFIFVWKMFGSVKKKL